MSGVGVTVLRDTAGPMVTRLRSALRIEGMTVVIGRAERNLFRTHLFALNARRHRPGGRNYYTQAARSVNVTQLGGSTIISIPQPGFRQRVQGGRIVPKAPRRFLTIADPGMPGYGKRASEFSDLDVGRAFDSDTGRLRWALIRRASTALRYTRRKQADGTIKTSVRPGAVQMAEPVFWLVRSVNQKPDPTVVPTAAEIIDTAIKAVDTRLNRLGGAS